jgi:hypothetical protein
MRASRHFQFLVPTGGGGVKGVEGEGTKGLENPSTKEDRDTRGVSLAGYVDP